MKLCSEQGLNQTHIRKRWDKFGTDMDEIDTLLHLLLSIIFRKVYRNDYWIGCLS